MVRKYLNEKLLMPSFFFLLPCWKNRALPCNKERERERRDRSLPFFYFHFFFSVKITFLFTWDNQFSCSKQKVQMINYITAMELSQNHLCLPLVTKLRNIINLMILLKGTLCMLLCLPREAGICYSVYPQQDFFQETCVLFSFLQDVNFLSWLLLLDKMHRLFYFMEYHWLNLCSLINRSKYKRSASFLV